MNSLKGYLSPTGAVEALLFNCSSPEVITAAFPVLKSAIASLDVSVKIGAYSNGFVQIFKENRNPEAIKGSTGSVYVIIYGA